MAIELIDQYVDRASFANDTEFIKAQIREALEAYTKLNTTKVGVNTSGSTRETSNAIKDLNAQLVKTAQLSDKAAATSLKLAKAQKEEATARKNNAQAAQAEAKAAEQIAKTKERESAATTRSNNAQREAIRSYKSLSREYIILRKVAEDYGASLGTQSKQYQEAAKRAAELNTKLKDIDAGIGNFQRNVGNYKSGFSGLSNSFNQITRELPAFTNSVQTGFLAISNNLPILFDEISRSRAELTRLREAGEKVPSLGSAIAKSFFTIGTALSLGVTALTIFGPQIVEFISSMFKGREAVDRFTESQKLLGEALKDGGIVDAASSVNELRINIDLAKQGLLDKDKVVKQFNETIGQTVGKVTSLDQAEQSLVKNGDAYIKMTLLKAAAQLALDKAAEKAFEAESTRQKKALEFTTFSDRAVASPIPEPGKRTPQQSDFQKKFIEEQGKKRREAVAQESEKDAKVFTDIAAEFQKKAAEISKSFNFDFFGGKGDKTGAADEIKTVRQKIFQDELKDFQKQLEELSKAEQLSIEARQRFREQAANIEAELLQQSTGYEIQLEKDKLNAILSNKDAGKNAKINAQNEYNAAVDDINRKSAFNETQAQKQLQIDLIKITAEGNKARIEEEKQLTEELNQQADQRVKDAIEAENNRLADITSKINTDSNLLAAAEYNKLAELEKARAKGKVSDAAYVDDKRRIELQIATIQADAQVSTLKAELDWAEAMLAIRKSLGADTIDEEEKIAELRKKIAEAGAKSPGLIGDVKQIDTLRDKYRELGNELKNLFGTIINAGFENQKNAIQEQIDLIEDRKQAEIEAINASALSEEDKANKIKIIEARANAEREQQEQKKRQVQQRQAQFEKALSIAGIIQNVAQGVTAALTSKPPNVPLAAVIGAIGAAQIATVLATPIPKYAQGTKDHPGGPMIVGDGGRSEVVVTPGGDVFKTPATDTLMYAPKGTEVFPSLEMFAKMNSRHIAPDVKVDVINSGMNEKIMKDQLRQMQRVESAIKSQPRSMGDGRVKVGNNWINYVQKNVFE